MKTKKCGFHKWRTLWDTREIVSPTLWRYDQVCVTCKKTKKIEVKIKAFARPLSETQIVTAEKRTKRIRAMSKEREKWIKLYIQSKKADLSKQVCSYCGKIGTKDNMECHHPYGRKGDRILKYLWLHKKCHKEIHDYGSIARADGWLKPEFDGRPNNLDTPTPWLEVLGYHPWEKANQSTDNKP